VYHIALVFQKDNEDIRQCRPEKIKENSDRDEWLFQIGKMVAFATTQLAGNGIFKHKCDICNDVDIDGKCNGECDSESIFSAARKIAQILGRRT